MAEEKLDRRVLRTKAMMQDALLTLMHEHAFSEITAKDITDQANLNRATFYSHYTSMFDLLDELEDRVLEGFAEILEETEIKKGDNWEYPIIGKICNHIAMNPQLFQCLFLNPRSDRMAEKLTEIMKQKGRRVRAERGMEPDSSKAEYIHQFIAWGAIGILKQWLAEGMSLSEEEMTKLAEELIHPIFTILSMA